MDQRRLVRCAGLVAALAAVVVVLVAVGTAGAAETPRAFLRTLSKQPFDPALLPAGFEHVGFACTTATLPGCAPRVPGAVGRVRTDLRGPTLAVVVYTVFPTRARARAWFRGKRKVPQFSLARLRQLNVESLPVPRLSGRIPGFSDSMFVESVGEKQVYVTGITAANALSGNVIVNATTRSRTSTRHGNRVVALQLLKAAVTRLGLARRFSQ